MVAARARRLPSLATRRNGRWDPKLLKVKPAGKRRTTMLPEQEGWSRARRVEKARAAQRTTHQQKPAQNAKD